jgi:hypothetical protein
MAYTAQLIEPGKKVILGPDIVEEAEATVHRTKKT